MWDSVIKDLLWWQWCGFFMAVHCNCFGCHRCRRNMVEVAKWQHNTHAKRSNLCKMKEWQQHPRKMMEKKPRVCVTRPDQRQWNPNLLSFKKWVGPFNLSQTKHYNKILTKANTQIEPTLSIIMQFRHPLPLLTLLFPLTPPRKLLLVIFIAKWKLLVLHMKKRRSMGMRGYVDSCTKTLFEVITLLREAYMYETKKETYLIKLE